MLEAAKTLRKGKVYTKSALMLGLGESVSELEEALKELRDVGVDFVTLGQYMRPTKKHLSVKQWVHPDVFTGLAETAKDLGFLAVASSPLVRSSYRAWDLYKKATRKASL